MKTWLTERWQDPAKFTATVRAVLAEHGALLAADIIPTGIPGAGPKIAAVLNTIAFGMAAGNKTPDGKE